jgi:hypothetical protein
LNSLVVGVIWIPVSSIKVVWVQIILIWSSLKKFMKIVFLDIVFHDRYFYLVIFTEPKQ